MNITATANDAVGAEFLRGFAQIGKEHDQKLNALCKQLQAEGVKALHPNDGWVTRLDNGVIQFRLAYPRYQMRFGVGDRVAFYNTLEDVTFYRVTRKIDSVWFDDKWEAVKA